MPLVGNEYFLVTTINPSSGTPNALPEFVTTAQVAALAGTGGTGYVTAVYTTNVATLTLPAIANLLEIIRQGIPAALTINLPASPASNLFVSVKDGGNNFQTNNATVKTTDGTQIDGVAGTTGFVMNQNRQQAGFIFDGTMWNVV